MGLLHFLFADDAEVLVRVLQDKQNPTKLSLGWAPPPITNKEELADVIKELKNCTPWKILDREPPLCKFFDSECQPRTENPYDSVTSALKALPPPRQSFDVAQPKLNSGTLRDLALETARQAAPQVDELDELD